MKLRVLLTGSADFMARAIQRRLAATAGFEILPVSGTLGSSMGAASDTAQLQAALAECDAIVNCMSGSAAAIRGNGNALAHALAGHRRPGLRVVHLSSMTVYGSAIGTVDEDAPIRDDLGAYAAARITAEAALQAVAKDAIVLRVGVEYGVDSVPWSQRIARLLLQRRLGDMGAAGDGCCNLVHLEDVALAVELALSTPTASGAFNLAMPRPPTWNEYLMRFALALRAVPVRRITRRRIKLESKILAPPLKAIEILMQRLHVPERFAMPPVPGSLIRAFGQDLRLDSRRATEVLGMTWRNLDVELQDIARHLRG
jgi:nucleoside-diphosphate-sugar epimerase